MYAYYNGLLREVNGKHSILSKLGISLLTYECEKNLKFKNLRNF